MLSPVYLLFTRDQNDDDDDDDDDIHSQMQVLLVVQVHKLLEMHTLQNASHATVHAKSIKEIVGR